MATETAIDVAPAEFSLLRWAEDPDGLKLTIRQRRAWPVIGFLSFWLGGWTLGGGTIIPSLIRDILKGHFGFPLFFLMFWGTGWALGEIVVALLLGLLLAGREEVVLTRDRLILRTAIGPFARTRELDLGQAQRLRVEVATPPADGRTHLPRICLAVDCGGKTYRFANGSDTTEVAMIRERLIGREPRLAAE